MRLLLWRRNADGWSANASTGRYIIKSTGRRGECALYIDDERVAVSDSKTAVDFLKAFAQRAHAAKR